MSKLEDLAEVEGYDDTLQMMSDAVMDTFSMGICTNEGCDYTCEVEPDSTTGWCEACGTNTVASSLCLGGII